MARRRHNNVITGSVSVEAHLLDAIGGGLCKMHGKYYGYGKYNLRDCPYCDLDECFKAERLAAQNHQDGDKSNDWNTILNARLLSMCEKKDGDKK